MTRGALLWRLRPVVFGGTERLDVQSFGKDGVAAAIVPPVPFFAVLFTAWIAIGWIVGSRSTAVRIVADRDARQPTRDHT